MLPVGYSALRREVHKEVGKKEVGWGLEEQVFMPRMREI